MFLKITLTLITWILYLEINPELGNIWIRTDHTGNKKVNLYNIITFVIESLKVSEMWGIDFFWENIIYAVPSIYIIFSLFEILFYELLFFII